ncbi:MAG TPA: hypothetical protein VE913_23865, partial [Longimicrobium sp.]|nr:hypothetical protein [Longimicrobium sp.]
GPLDEEQRARLAQIAELCPVHKSLAGAFHIRTAIVVPLSMDSIERARALVGDMEVDQDEDLGDDVYMN